MYTGADIAARTSAVVPLVVPEGHKFEPILALAVDKVRFVGDPVAIVVADSRYVAEDACELIDVEYEPLDAIATFEQALDPTRPKIFESLDSNVLFEMDSSYGDVDAAFARADAVVRQTFAQHRVAQMPMEGRGGVGDFNPETGDFVYHTGTQSPHTVKAYIAEALGIPPQQTRTVNGDIGGAFGLKIACHREDIAVCAAAYWLGRPVKWIEDRNEHLQSSGQAREERMATRSRRHERRHDSRDARRTRARPGRLSGRAVRRWRHRRHGRGDDARAVRVAGLRHEVDRRGQQQVHVQRLSRSVGGRDLGAGTHDRCRRPAVGVGSGRRTAPEFRAQRRQRVDAERPHPARQLLRPVAGARPRVGRLPAAAP